MNMHAAVKKNAIQNKLYSQGVHKFRKRFTDLNAHKEFFLSSQICFQLMQSLQKH